MVQIQGPWFYTELGLVFHMYSLSLSGSPLVLRLPTTLLPKQDRHMCVCVCVVFYDGFTFWPYSHLMFLG